MNILIASSEVVPFAKTGGLADVAGALPLALQGLGHDVRAILPRYREVDRAQYALTPATPAFAIPVGDQRLEAQLFTTTFPGTRIPVYLVEQPALFDRDGLYQVQGKDHPDNLERFTAFCRAILEGLPLTNWTPDVIHVNDWQTALVSTYLKTHYREAARWRQVATVFTVHNLAYQGTFPKEGLRVIGLGEEHWSPARLEFYGKLNLLKAGLLDSDVLTTVSPTYAQEIQTPAFGCGLEGVLHQRRDALHGILNGVDTASWNPAVDALLPARYTSQDLAGKAVCKRTLQQERKLPVEAATPLIGMITRLADQKGLDLVAGALPALFKHGACQVVLLGSGDPKYHREFEALAAQYPDRLSVALTFDNRLAHLIEAGSDCFLMPSRYEPCGLNQMYSLNYGTVPVVRRTGGLADTVVDASPATLRAGTANGFMFEDTTVAACVATLIRALTAYRDHATWRQLMLRGMRQDFSWTQSAKDYARLYAQLRPDVSRRAPAAARARSQA